MSFLKRIVPLRAEMLLQLQTLEIEEGKPLTGVASLESKDNFRVENVLRKSGWKKPGKNGERCILPKDPNQNGQLCMRQYTRTMFLFRNHLTWGKTKRRISLLKSQYQRITPQNV